jgi:hypothetical protein
LRGALEQRQSPEEYYSGSQRKSFKFDEMMGANLSITPRDKAEILARAMSYTRKFHCKTLAIKFGGNDMTDPALTLGMA